MIDVFRNKSRTRQISALKATTKCKQHKTDLKRNKHFNYIREPTERNFRLKIQMASLNDVI